MKDKFGTVAFQCKVLEAIQFNSNFLRIGLIVIGDVISAYNGVCFIKKILSFCKAKDDTVSRITFGFDEVDNLLHNRACIFGAVGF